MFHRIGGQTFISRAYYRFVGKLATKCFVYSRKGAEVLLGLGVDYNKIHIIGMALNEKKSTEMLEKITESKLGRFICDNNLIGKKIVLQVVRLSKIKKPDLVLDVAKKVALSHPDIVFILIGGGELYDEMCSKVFESGLQDSVRLLGPLYDEEKLSYWFKVADVFIMPTCIGLSAHHAFSYGLPIVTDDNLLEQASEFDILADGLNARLYRAGDIDSFKEAILSIIDNENLQKFMSKNAFYSVASINSLDSKCKRYLEAIDRY
jgi:glycosyltransferase involved in cell wall biosynthesis